MIRNSSAITQPTTACAYAVLLVSLALGLIGLIADDDDVMRGGILLGIAALPALVAGHFHHANRANDDQLAAAHRAGYELALDHVARGLLDQHNATPPHGRPYDLDDTALEAAGVRRLHVVRHNHNGRHAV
ncbi:hypothetical protein [Streptomyces antimycoticus]|uniref:hypothetical protein n=1 Tax=Streptomyces antimycoticus TaxID=68175 RepID=UPI0033C478EC